MKSKTWHSIRALWLGPVTALCLMSAGATAQTTPPAGSSSGMLPGQMQMGSDDMKKSMMSGMEGMQNMPMSGDTDKDFATMMKMHHQQAVNMAQMELTNGKSPEMKAMAKRIIAAQKKEIAEFDKWLAKKK
jgi:uncharacterized protein (DUF305 family)